MPDAFAARIRAAPRPYDARRGADAAAKLSADGPLRDLLVGVGGSSPFLARLIETETAWLAKAAEAEPERAVPALLEEVAGAAGLKPVASALRRAKRRAALLVALADLGGVWSLEEVTGALSDLADGLLSLAAEAAFAAETRGPLAGRDPVSAGFVALAMGKLGARELNYSSDIDLIFLFDETRWEPDAALEAKPRFVQSARRIVKLLSEVDAEGYAFRTDLRLRPNPTTTPICLSTASAEAYYESVGRTWERAAYIKARPAAGDRAAGARFLKTLEPFVFRRHLDFAAIEDAHDMRLKIRAKTGAGEALAAPGLDVKLGYGGIREIEFFAQTQQLVHGGRDPSLRDRATRPALAALTRAGVVDEESRAALDAAYAAHRALEHRLQMLEDAQTQTIPRSAENRARIAALGGWAEAAAMEAEVVERCRVVRRICDRFFTAEPLGPRPETPADFAALGFADPEGAAGRIEGWMAGRIAATRGERSRRRFRAVAPMIMERLAAAAAPDEAIAVFDGFLSGLPAGAQIFALLEANPHLLDLLTEICAAAPRLGAYLGRHSDVLDAVLDHAFFDAPPPAAALAAELRERLSQTTDYEEALDAARRWAKERRFQIGVQTLRGVARAHEAGAAFTAIADAALSELFPVVVAEFARKHGPPPGAGAAALGMGKLGSAEMTATSDLDLLFIYDPAGAEESEGPRPLPAPTYYGRLAQALIAALSAPTAEGVLYPVDMRLRPSGRQGPVATRLSAFRAYQLGEAWTWEHMALTRARPVAGEAAVRAEAAAAAAAALSLPRDPGRTLADVRDMRARLSEARAAERADPWAFKHAEGGLMDVEFALQAGLLLTGLHGARAPRDAAPRLEAAGWLTPEAAARLAEAHGLMTALQQVERVALDRPFDPARAGAGLRAAMARAADLEDFTALETRLVDAQRAAAATVDAVLGGAA